MTFDESERAIRRNRQMTIFVGFAGWLVVLFMVVWMAGVGR
jgi:hypothetical protein